MVRVLSRSLLLCLRRMSRASARAGRKWRTPTANDRVARNSAEISWTRSRYSARLYAQYRSPGCSWSSSARANRSSDHSWVTASTLYTSPSYPSLQVNFVFKPDTYPIPRISSLGAAVAHLCFTPHAWQLSTEMPGGSLSGFRENAGAEKLRVPQWRCGAVFFSPDVVDVGSDVTMTGRQVATQTCFFSSPPIN